MSARLTTFALASTAVALTGALAASPAAATADLEDAVISLGDSYISGEAGRWRGNGNTGQSGSVYGTDLAAVNCNSAETRCDHDPTRPYEPASYQDGCNRSTAVAEYGVKGSEIHHVDSVLVDGQTYSIAPRNRLNIACSGATTANVFATGFKGEPVQTTQLAKWAKSKRIRLVVLSIGGNDIDFSGIIENCVKRFTFWASPCNESLREKVNRDIKGMAKNITTTILAIKDALYDHEGEYRFVVQSYPAPLPQGANIRYAETLDGRWRKGGCPLYDKDADWAHDEVIPTLAAAIQGAIGTNPDGTPRADFLDVRQALAGHELCRLGVRQAQEGETLKNAMPKQQAEWVRWIGVPDYGQGQKQEFLHPNVHGQEALGACLNTIANQAVTTYACPAPSTR